MKTYLGELKAYLRATDHTSSNIISRDEGMILPLSKFLHVVEHLPFHKILGSQGYMHVASDCSLDVSSIRKESMGSTGSIVSKIRSRAAFLNDCSFVHKRRASNFESRNLHRHALSCDVGRHVWLFALAPYSVNIISE
jgi:hypothetical protein